MDKLKIVFVVLLAVTLSTAFLNHVQAQGLDVEVHITPDEAEIEIGEGLKLEAFAFSLGNAVHRPVAIDAISYEVTPDSLGTITEDGFFVAGRHVGVVKIKVTVRIGNRTLVKVVCIRIGKLPKPFFDVKVIPEKAVVPAGTEKQFEVVIRTPRGDQVRPGNVQWEVQPDDLGKINQEGLFTAGDREGRGKIIAVVELDGLRLSAAARVVVSPPATGAIAGNISNDAGGVIAGAVIKAFRLGQVQWIQHAESDDAGNYRVGNLIPGNYVLYANARGFIGEFYDNTRDYLQAFVLTISEEDTLTDKNFGLSEGATIAGKVTDESGNPLAGAHVFAALKLNLRFAKHTTSHEDGSYEIGELPTGGYVAAANAPGYQVEFFDDKRDLNAANIINLQEPDRVDTVNFDLSLASAISGVVRDAVTQDPIAGAFVRVFSPFVVANKPSHPFRETRTNENGEYLVQLPPGDDYRVVAHHEMYATQWYDGKTNRAEANPVQVTENSHTTGIDFDLLKRGSIAGKVTDQSTGAAIAGAIVQAFPETGVFDVAGHVTVAGFRAKTDEEGNYLLGGLMPGVNYIVMAAAEEYLPEFWEEKATKDQATLINLTAGEARDGINFTLLPGGSISGTVASAVDSLPIPRALVNVFDVDSRHHRRGFTDEEGNYKVGGLPTGRYFVQVIADGFFAQFYEEARHRAEADTVDVLAPDETTDKDLFLHPKVNRRGTIAGRVFADDNESPIFGAVVIAVSPKNRLPHIGFTGPRGFYELTDLPPGRYYVFAWARGFVGEFFKDAKRFKNADPVPVESGQVTHGINFGLKSRHRAGAYTIRGKIRSQVTQSPVQGVLIRALSTDGGTEISAVTDINGKYTLFDIPAGAYKIEASGVGYEDGFFGGTNDQNATTVFVGNGQDGQGADINLGLDTVTSIDDDEPSVPGTFTLFQNYPNPFNPETQIRYQLTDRSEVTLKIFNLLGQEVITLVNKEQPAGSHSVQWDGKDNLGRPMASGVYIFQMKAGKKFTISKRMVLLK